MKAQMEIKREGKSLFVQKDAEKWRTRPEATKKRSGISVDAGRWVLCALLIGILAVSGMRGVGQQEEKQTAAAPVVSITPQNDYSEESISFADTVARLSAQRQEELAILEAVAADALTDEATRKQALAQQVQIAVRLESQAGIEEALAYMGYTQAAAICADERVVVIMPDGAARESEMVQIIDAVCSVGGCEAKDVKIILAKK